MRPAGGSRRIASGLSRHRANVVLAGIDALECGIPRGRPGIDPSVIPKGGGSAKVTALPKEINIRVCDRIAVGIIYVPFEIDPKRRNLEGDSAKCLALVQCDEFAETSRIIHSVNRDTLCHFSGAQVIFPSGEPVELETSGAIGTRRRPTQRTALKRQGDNCFANRVAAFGINDRAGNHSLRGRLRQYDCDGNARKKPPTQVF